jgi:hypothetical protein
MTKPDNTDEVQVGNPCKRAKITPECIQHGGAVAEVKKKKTIATTKKVRKVVKKSTSRKSDINYIPTENM